MPSKNKLHWSRLSKTCKQQCTFNVKILYMVGVCVAISSAVPLLVAVWKIPMTYFIICHIQFASLSNMIKMTIVVVHDLKKRKRMSQIRSIYMATCSRRNMLNKNVWCLHKVVGTLGPLDPFSCVTVSILIEGLCPN